jgi:hypothetical protein
MDQQSANDEILSVVDNQQSGNNEIIDFQRLPVIANRETI